MCSWKLGRHGFKLLFKKSELLLSCAIAVFQGMIYGTTTDREGFHYQALELCQLVIYVIFNLFNTLLSDTIITCTLLMRKNEAQTGYATAPMSDN